MSYLLSINQFVKRLMEHAWNRLKCAFSLNLSETMNMKRYDNVFWLWAAMCTTPRSSKSEQLSWHIPTDIIAIVLHSLPWNESMTSLSFMFSFTNVILKCHSIASTLSILSNMNIVRQFFNIFSLNVYCKLASHSPE